MCAHDRSPRPLQKLPRQETRRNPRRGPRQFHLPTGQNLWPAGRQWGRQNHHAAHARHHPRTHRRHRHTLRPRRHRRTPKSPRQRRLSLHRHRSLSPPHRARNGRIFRTSKWPRRAHSQKAHRLHLRSPGHEQLPRPPLRQPLHRHEAKNLHRPHPGPRSRQ